MPIFFCVQTVKELMEVMKDKDTLLQVRNNNHQRLLEELDGVITQLDLDSRHVKALNNASFTSSQAIMLCTDAANALQRCLTADISPGKCVFIVLVNSLWFNDELVKLGAHWFK